MQPFPSPARGKQRLAIIDEFGQLQQDVDAFKPKKDRHAELRDQIASWYEKEPARQPFVEHGLRFTLQVSECANERTVSSMSKLFKFLGVEAFLKLCKLPLGAVDAAVPKIRHKEFLTEEPTGPRKIKAVPKFPVAEIAGLKKAA
jgi:hypothetical protein